MKDMDKNGVKQKSQRQTRLRACYAADPEKYKARASRYKKKLRLDVLALYGNKCACCGERQSLFLELDHVNNNGGSHRRDKNGKRRDNRIAYSDALKNSRDYQLLCANCNKGKHLNSGVCPHKTAGILD